MGWNDVRGDGMEISLAPRPEDAVTRRHHNHSRHGLSLKITAVGCVTIAREAYCVRLMIDN